MSKIIDRKIEELRIILEQELSETVVKFEVEFTGTGTHTRIEHRYPDDLRNHDISMRNITGEFIK